MGSGGMAGYGGMAAAPKIRRKFVNTAYWVADLVTGTDGKARTSFDFPDNLTSWRFTARGITADTRVGEIRVNHRTFLPLEVDFALPRGFRAGDRIDLPVVLHNNTEQPRTVRGTTRINQGNEQPWAARPLAARADDRLTIPLTAASTDPMTLFASVGDPETGDGDAVERQLVPLKRGHRFTRAYSGPLGKEVVIPVEPGAPWTEDGLVLTVRREAGLAGPVASALDELIQYPYGCVEQTMSRFMPAVVAARALEAAGVDNPAAGRLPDVIAKGLARLADYQHRDGGWGWWKDDATNDFMTAYVLLGLARCRQTGERVPDRMIDNGQRYLIGRLQKGQLAGHRPGNVGDVNLAVYAAYALATLYHQDSDAYAQGLAQVAAAVKSVQDGGTKLALLDEILLGNTWHLLGDQRQARAYLVKLEDRVEPDSGNRSTIIAAGGLLELGAAVEPKAARWPRLARQLVSARRGTGWGDTLTTSAAVRGLAAVLAVPRRDDVPVVVRVDGREVGVLPPGDDDAIRLELPSVERVSLHPSKPGCANFYSVRVEGYLERAPANPVKPAVILRTRVFRLQPERVELLPGGSGRLAVPRGVTLQVQVEVELKRAASHTRLSWPRPCGVELVRSPKPAAGVVATEERDDAMRFFVGRWEKGTHRVDFLARAEVSGSVSVPLPEVVPMYDDTQPTAVFAPTCWGVNPNDECRMTNDE